MDRLDRDFKFLTSDAASSLQAMPKSLMLPDEAIVSKIYLIRGMKVMLDFDLADFFRVTTGNLNLQVKRNSFRFPTDFMFQLTAKESADLKLQFAISRSWGGRRKLSYAFTEHGVLMLSSVLRSEQAITVNIHIMRVFTRMNKLLSTNAEILRKLEGIERKLADHDEGIIALFEQVKLLMEQPALPRKRLGYKGGDHV